ncbi:MAG: 4a-hydroxytetrahydrobiopterin dehydratase [Paracoccus sp. (in: a-proteobacteria)]|uniref:4a-hydroxytetrahydrobiopterin dehydratase n=1 Tax=Paracoccus sp. TaxID=267 RepID=UPI00391D196D
MTTGDLSQRTCQGKAPPCGPDEIRAMMAQLTGWQLSGASDRLTRRFEFKGFARAVEMANLAAWLGNKQGHHPDIAFGWGYCTVTFTTHDAGGLTVNDFICASRLDALVA